MKALDWIGSSKDDLKNFPEPIQDIFGFALYLAQIGIKHIDAKPLKGFGSAGILEIIASDRDGTFRGVYTVRLKHKIYVLHCFQKKSTKGIQTTRQDMELIKQRLKQAEEKDNKL